MHNIEVYTLFQKEINCLRSPLCAKVYIKILFIIYNFVIYAALNIS